MFSRKGHLLPPTKMHRTMQGLGTRAKAWGKGVRQLWVPVRYFSGYILRVAYLLPPLPPAPACSGAIKYTLVSINNFNYILFVDCFVLTVFGIDSSQITHISTYINCWTASDHSAKVKDIIWQVLRSLCF